MAASTGWKENVAPDEDARFARYGEQLVELQKRVGAASRMGRALHHKQHLGLRATLEVLGELPDHARHGLFAKPGRYDATVRLSNGGGRTLPDRKPDVRGFAIRIDGVEGPGALGAATTAQCFLLINSETFSFPNAEEFIGVVVAASRSPLAVLRYLIKSRGLFGGFSFARKLGKGLGKPFAGFTREPFYSAAPIACGPYAAKVRLVSTTPDAPAASRDDWSANVIGHLAKHELAWDLQLQFFVDEATTPIEDPTVAWPSPFVTVARLVVPPQDPASGDGAKLAAAIEAGKLDPWIALAAHRPLGEIMRARKAAYFASQQARGAA